MSNKTHLVTFATTYVLKQAVLQNRDDKFIIFTFSY